MHFASPPGEHCSDKFTMVVLLWDVEVWLSLISNWNTKPSSPADQNTKGLSGAVASRLTRSVWQEQFQMGDFLLTSVTYIYLSAAAVAIKVLLLFGRNFVENMFPMCDVLILSFRFPLNGSQIPIWKSSEPEISIFPSSDHSRQLTHPLWPFRTGNLNGVLVYFIFLIKENDAKLYIKQIEWKHQQTNSLFSQAWLRTLQLTQIMQLGEPRW